MAAEKLQDPADALLLGKDIHFPAYGNDSIVSQVMFVTGKRGSGKSWLSLIHI